MQNFVKRVEVRLRCLRTRRAPPTLLLILLKIKRRKNFKKRKKKLREKFCHFSFAKISAFCNFFFLLFFFLIFLKSFRFSKNGLTALCRRRNRFLTTRGFCIWYFKGSKLRELLKFRHGTVSRVTYSNYYSNKECENKSSYLSSEVQNRRPSTRWVWYIICMYVCVPPLSVVPWRGGEA